MKTKNIIKSIGILVLGLGLGWIIFGGNNTSNEKNNQQTTQTENIIWTCSMDPQIRQTEAGKCPLCGMDLIPLENNDVNINGIEMTENAMKLANIQTMIVGSKTANKEIRLNGKIKIDERKLYSQTTHIPGRIEQLKIDFTGEKVSRGQTLAVIYSPELVTAQEELLQAYSIKNSQPELFEAAKQKLHHWKINENTITKILSSGKPIQKFPITADVSGIVTTKKVALGDYVSLGMPLYEIADLSSVWVLFDVYESDMAWVKVGDNIHFTIQSFPGEKFEGNITFLDPIINAETRVSTARIELKNIKNNLKPEMFVSGILQHDLSKTSKQEIIIPKSAVLWTGERSIVYVKNNASNNSIFSLREVTLGASLGNAYIIKSGLENGEEIVVNGTFTVDAASQLAGKRSMMNPEDGAINNDHNHGENEIANALEKAMLNPNAKNALKPLYQEYFNLKDALVADDFTNAKKASSAMQKALSSINMSLSYGENHEIWMRRQNNLKIALQQAPNFKTIEEIRKAFEHISENMIAITNEFKPYGETLYVQFCPMVDNNKGAYWLSLSETIYNPYFGSKMLKCGSVKTIIE